MTMLRSISPAMSEISVGSPSPPPGNSFQCVTIKRLKPTVELHSAETIKFPPPLTLPQRRRSSAERVKSFSIADILGKKEREEEKSRLNSPKPLPPAPQPPSIPIAGPVLPPHLIPERLQPGLTVPAPLLMLDLPNLHKVIPPGWDASGNPVTVSAQSSNPTAAGPALPLHHFFPPALMHYEQRLAWDYQRQLQEHFQAQAQLLRQMSLDPNIIPSEDGSERSRSSSAGSRCYSPDVNVAGDDDEDGDEEEDGKAGYKRGALTPGDKACAKREENATESKTKKSASDTPLDALFQLSTKNFDEDQDPATLNIFATRPNPKKKRKSRTAFTNHQIFELEKRFLYQKYLSPADRDEIAAGLGLSNAQVITWFQNRRAKLKRDMEELKKDVESVKQLSAHKSFLENVNDLSILKTRPVSRHQPAPPPPPPAGAIQHNAEVLTAAHTHGHHITAVYNSGSSSSSNSSISTTITDRRLYTEPNLTVHIPPRHHQQQQQQQLQSQPHHATTNATIAANKCNERRDDITSESSSESLQPQQNPAAAAAAAAAELQQQQPRNLQINHSRG